MLISSSYRPQNHLHQDSLFTEPESRNGLTKYVHYVIKNTPFCVRLSVAGTRINFTNSSLHCSLLYDFDHLDDLKPVDAVKGQSLDYVMQPDASGISFCYPNQVDRPARWSSRSDDVTHKVM